MRRSLHAARGSAVVTAFALGTGLGAWGRGSTGQSSSGQSSPGQSLGDVARETRKEHASAGHVPAQQVTNEDEDGPDAGGVWRVHLCPQTPCYQLSVTLPRSPKWSQAARIVLDEHLLVDGRAAIIAHFTVNGDGLKYRGLNVVTVAGYGNFGFACVFREEDSSAAASICDAIVKSAKSQTLEAAKRRTYPTYPDPANYRRYDEPPDDPPDSDDQE